METVVIVVVLLAMIALGVLLIHRLNAQHNDRIASFRYGRSRTTPQAPAPPRPGDYAGPSDTGARRDHRDGGRGRFRPRRPTRKSPG